MLLGLSLRKFVVEGIPGQAFPSDTSQAPMGLLSSQLSACLFLFRYIKLPVVIQDMGDRPVLARSPPALFLVFPSPRRVLLLHPYQSVL